MGQNATAAPAGIPRVDDVDVLRHELGNVLHGIRCVAGLLRDSGLEPRQRRWLAAIEASCAQMERILERPPARGVGADAPPHVEHFDGLCLLERLILSHAPRAADKGVALSLRTAPDLPAEWSGDPGLIGQLLENLVGNAVRYTRCGAVVVEARRSRHDHGALRLAILDSGPGIEEPERLFEPYRRGAAGRDGSPGHGLGLFLCRGIVERLGGTLSCRNRRSGGACFEVTLPRMLP
jgi:signal transduction histidine kinase